MINFVITLLKTFRKYYLPGIISLVGCSLIYLISSQNSSTKEKSLEILYSNDHNQFQFAKPFLDTTNANFEYIKLNNPKHNFQIIKKTFKANCKSNFKNYLVFDINSILYQDFTEIINQCKIHQIKFCYHYHDTILVSQKFNPEKRVCGNGAPRNLLNEFSLTNMPQLVFKNGKIRKATKIEAIWIEYKDHLKRYSPFALFAFGMLFFYYILPFIQSKISSKQSPTLH